MMGRTWSVDDLHWDTLRDVASTGTTTTIWAESPRVEADLIYVGTDDGLIQVTENGGARVAAGSRHTARRLHGACAFVNDVQA